MTFKGNNKKSYLVWALYSLMALGTFPIGLPAWAHTGDSPFDVTVNKPLMANALQQEAATPTTQWDVQDPPSLWEPEVLFLQMEDGNSPSPSSLTDPAKTTAPAIQQQATTAPLIPTTPPDPLAPSPSESPSRAIPEAPPSMGTPETVLGSVSPVMPPQVTPETPSGLEKKLQALPAASYNKATKVVIDRSARKMTVYQGSKVLFSFPVGVGMSQFPTPKGTFSIITMQKNPVWENPYQPEGRARKIAAGKGNPLGTRWMGFKRNNAGEFGMHGTNRPESVGQYSSHGCVRMLIPHAEALYDVVELGTPVEIR